MFLFRQLYLQSLLSIPYLSKMSSSLTEPRMCGSLDLHNLAELSYLLPVEFSGVMMSLLLDDISSQ